MLARAVIRAGQTALMDKGSTRHIDLGRKRQLYAARGLPWYWFVDLANNELVVLRNDSGVFVEVQRLTSGTTMGPVEITLTVADL
ncbi:MAG TPA: Uma2 family endonuclease [Acidothermaceae bacterium]